LSYSEEVPNHKSNIAIASATFDEGAAALNNVKVIYRVSIGRARPDGQ